jgi:hypothetical protein
VGVAGRARTILLAIICLLLFTAGIFVGNMTVTTVTKTMTLTETSTTTEYVTVTAEPPLLVITKAELYPSCVFNSTSSSPEEDPNCTRNIKALTLLLVVKNVGRAPVKVCPRSVFIHAFGVGPSPYYVRPAEDEVILEPGSYSLEITGIFFPREPESVIRFYNDFGGFDIFIAYGSGDGNCTEVTKEKAIVIPGVWWPGAGS